MASDLLADLVRLVTLRARRIDAEGPYATDALESLREAVDALGQLLDAASFVRRSRDELERGSAAHSVTVEPLATPDRPRTVSTEPRPVSADPRSVTAASSATHLSPDPRPPATDRARRTGGEDAPAALLRDRTSGLYTREGFEAITAGEIKKCSRHGRALSILLIRCGSGDGAPVDTAARTLRGSLRESDVCGLDLRGIIAIALPETDLPAARAAASRLVANLGRADAWGRDSGLGLSVFPAQGETLWTLLENARAQLVLPIERVLASGSDDGYWSG